MTAKAKQKHNLILASGLLANLGPVTEKQAEILAKVKKHIINSLELMRN